MKTTIPALLLFFLLSSHAMPGADDAAAEKPAARDKPVAAAATLDEPGWKSLFDGKSMKGWEIDDFGGSAIAEVREGQLVVGLGERLSGASYTGAVPKIDYEVYLEARRNLGGDFFCGLTFPYKDNHATLILGGWGGSLVGLSSINDMDASENAHTKYMRFEDKRWYKVRVRATESKIEAWLDDEKILDIETEGRKISLRPGMINLSAPFGLATFQTEGAFRNIRIRELPAADTGE